MYTSTCDLNSNGTINLEAQAVNNAVNQGVVVAAASGNNGVDNGIVSPACASKAIAVGAIDQLDHRTAFSNEGTNLAVVAPGVAITSLRSPSNGGGFIALSGTSMATPHVVGLTALLLEKNPNLTPQQVRTTIQNTALDLGTPGFDTIYGNGRIRANNAILAIFHHLFLFHLQLVSAVYSFPQIMEAYHQYLQFLNQHFPLQESLRCHSRLVFLIIL